MKVIQRTYVTLVQRHLNCKATVYYAGDNLDDAKGVILKSDYRYSITIWENGKYKGAVHKVF